MAISCDDFLKYLEAKKLSRRTCKDYLHSLKLLLKEPGEGLTQKKVRQFLHSHNNGVCRAFVLNLISFLKLYPDKAKEYGCSLRRVRRIELPKITGRKKQIVHQVIGEAEVELIRKAMTTRRDRVMLLLTFYCGLRANELITIQYKNIFIEKWAQKPSEFGEIKVYGKGNKEAIIYVRPDIMKRLYNYIRKRELREDEIEKPLFKIGVWQWAHVLGIASKKALGRHINPHLLRHSFATVLYNKGMDVMSLQQVMRHTDLRSTQIYTHIDPEKLKAKLNKYLPPVST